MHQEQFSLSNDKKQVVNTKCAICNQIITDKDLVTIGNSEEKETLMHFKCYVEIQEKICSACGVPFQDQEKVWFCEEHREYLHVENRCILKHLSKHMSFKEGIYDSTKNRVSFLEDEEYQSMV